MNGDDKNGSKRIWIIAGVAVVVAVAFLVAAWFLGRPAYHRFKEERCLVQAREFLKKGDYRSGALALRQALTLNPANVEATRLMADLAAEAQSPAALALWQRVVALSPTFDNKVLLAAVGLRVEKPPFPLTSQTLDELRALGEANTAFHLVASQFALKLNRIADAETHLEAAARLQPTNRLHRLNLATIRLQRSDVAVADAARRELETLVSDPALGAHVLRSLTADALLRHRADGALGYSQKLLALPQATFADRLQHLTVLREATSADLPAWLARAQQEASTNALRIAQTVNWMIGHERAKEALAWLAALPTAMRNTMPIPLAEADGFVAVRDWPGLETRLQEQRWDDQEFIRLALLARALRGQHQNAVANAVWRRAVSAAGTRAGFTAALAQVALGWGWNTEAEDLLWAAAKREPQNDWPLQTLARSYSLTNDTAGMYRVHQALLERHPKSDVLKNNVAMFALLLNRDLPRATGLAREVCEAAKTNAFFVSTYAFALHRQGKTAEGLHLMQTLPETELQRPEIAIYYAVLLSATGAQERAKVYVAAAEKARMLPEERRLLAEAK